MGRGRLRIHLGAAPGVGRAYAMLSEFPGSRNAKRWQDVEELLAAGVGVISTVNIQHLESLGDVVEPITGVRQRETVPDEVVHGNIHQPDKVDAALSNYFRPGNLTALRELALLWVADRVDEYLRAYRGEHRVSKIWGSRERIVVGLTGGPGGGTLIRRAARLAEEGAGGEVLAVCIARSDGLTSASPKELAVQRTLVEDLGGTFHHVVGDDIPAALLEFARGVNAPEIVLGSSRRKSWQYVRTRRSCWPGLRRAPTAWTTSSTCPASRPARSAWTWTSPSPCPWSPSTPGCWSARSPASWRTPSSTARPAPPSWSPPAPSPTGSRCASWTADPASPTPPRSASSTPRTLPGGGLTMVLTLRAGAGTLVHTEVPEPERQAR